MNTYHFESDPYVRREGNVINFSGYRQRLTHSTAVPVPDPDFDVSYHWDVEGTVWQEEEEEALPPVRHSRSTSSQRKRRNSASRSRTASSRASASRSNGNRSGSGHTRSTHAASRTTARRRSSKRHHSMLALADLLQVCCAGGTLVLLITVWCQFLF
jgi:hypothetical protein